MNDLMLSSGVIVDYHEEKNNQDSDKSSIGNISSADDKDLELILSGQY